MNDHSAAIGRLEGEIKHLAADLATGRSRLHELSNAAQRVETRLQTLIETATPQRERMINDLAEIKDIVVELKPVPEHLSRHADRIDSLEHFRSRSLATIGTVGGIAGLAATALGLAIKQWLLGK